MARKEGTSFEIEYKVVLKSNTHLISDFIESALFLILTFGCSSPMGNSYILKFQNTH